MKRFAASDTRSVWTGTRVRRCHDVLLEQRRGRHAVVKRLAPVQHLVQDDAGGPHVHFARDAHVLAVLEALGRQVPVRARALRRQLNAVRRRRFIHRFGQAKVGDFHLALMKQNVARFEIIVNDFVAALAVAVAQRVP